MSFLLPHLRSGWAVDQAILTEEDRVVCLRFGRDGDDTCMRMDEVSVSILLFWQSAKPLFPAGGGGWDTLRLRH
jgi:hypothetical protein